MIHHAVYAPDGLAKCSMHSNYSNSCTGCIKKGDLLKFKLVASY